MKLHFELITPERMVVDTEVDAVSVETPEGQITILPDHIPIVVLLVAGEVILHVDGRTEYLATSQGFLQVLPGSQVRAFVDSAEKPEEIKVDVVEEARKRAQEAMKTKRDKLALYKAKLEHEKSLARLHVAKRHRRHTLISEDTENPNL